jgi:hypothetical protein
MLTFGAFIVDFYFMEETVVGVGGFIYYRIPVDEPGAGNPVGVEFVGWDGGEQNLFCFSHEA